MYRIRRRWNDSASQVGAFTSLESAKKACPCGYTVFDEEGNMMYRVCTVKDYEAGMETDLYNAAVYASSTCTTGSIKNGTFYIYDGVVVNGRVRITDKKENCGKKPLANYVTGWIDQTDVFFF